MGKAQMLHPVGGDMGINFVMTDTKKLAMSYAWCKKNSAP